MISKFKQNTTLLSMALLFLNCNQLLPKANVSNDTLPKNYYILNCRLDGSGFFSIFHYVLGALDFMENDQDCSGLTIDFEDSGFYHDEAYGDNWWEYYFEPVNLGVKTENIKYFPFYKQPFFSESSQYGMSRERGYELINKYAILKPHIQEKIDTFVSNNFQNTNVIGIHYRGTDKCIESDIVSYKDVRETLLPLMEQDHKTYKIFIATDDSSFLAYMKAHFPGQIIATSVIRSDEGKPVHYKEKNKNYQKGEEALIDCILLSKCDFFVKMDSNLSDCAIKFNPHIPIIELNKKEGEEASDTNISNPDTYVHVDSVNAPPHICIFRQLGVVLSILEQYENKQHKGVKVDFERDGKYYSRYRGDNWWTYFFEPLEVGDVSGESKRVPRHKKSTLSTSVIEKSPQKMHELVKKYIKVQPEITQKVSEFRQEHLHNSFVVGVHYESDRPRYGIASTSYKDLYDVISVHLAERNNTKILVHTNDKKFYSYLKVKHPDKVVQYKEEYSELKADEAKNELVNCLLLSQADQLLCTPSRFSLAASWFNPKLPITEFGVNPELKAGPRSVKTKSKTNT